MPRANSITIFPHTRNLRAFTLIEIVLCMVIIVILAGAVIGNMSAGYRDLALEGDTALMAHLIHGAQQQARARRCLTRLEIDRNLQLYRFEESRDGGRTFDPLYNQSEDISLSQGIDCIDIRKLGRKASRGDRLLFFPDGRSEATRIVLEGRDLERRVILVGGLHGMPRVEVE